MPLPEMTEWSCPVRKADPLRQEHLCCCRRMVDYMNVCWIVGAGDFSPDDLCELRREDGDVIIAADNGLTYLTQMDMVPDYIIGDYDSLQPEGREGLSSFICAHPGRERHLPKEKDDTDTMAAVRWGFELGYAQFRLCGALGGSRVDHTIANLQTLLFIKGRGGRGRIVGTQQELFLVRDERMVFPPDCRGGFSLFAIDAKVQVTIRGMKYEGDGLTLTYDFPLGCSNEFLPGQTASVAVCGGTVLAVMDRQRSSGGQKRNILV